MNYLRAPLVFLALFAAALPIAFAQSPQPPLTPAGPDLMINGGFELGTQSWGDNFSNISSIISTGAFSGTQALRLTGGRGGHGQQITSGFQEAGHYRLSAYARVGSVNDGATLVVHFLNRDNVNIMHLWKTIRSTDYQQYTYDFQVPYGTTAIRVMPFKNWGNQTADFDNVQLVRLVP